jgi:hypothetical protein
VFHVKNGGVSRQKRRCFTSKTAVFHVKNGGVSRQKRRCFTSKTAVFHVNLVAAKPADNVTGKCCIATFGDYDIYSLLRFMDKGYSHILLKKCGFRQAARRPFAAAF